MISNQTSFTHSLNELSLIIDSINRGVYGIDNVGKCTFINQAALKMLGYKLEECIGKDIHRLIHYKRKDGEDYPENECAICQSKSNYYAHEQSDEVFWKSDGSFFFIRYSSSPIIDNGILNGRAIAFSDITEQKVKEAKLAESEKKYKYIFENNPLPMFIWDFETLQIVDCNEEALIKYKYTRNEFLNLNIRQIRPEEDIPLIDSATVNEEIYGSIHRRTWRHKKKDGSIMHVEVTGHIVDFNDRRASLVLINDVTDKFKAENELKASEEKLRAATEIAKLGYWQTDVNGDNRYWSDELYKIWGVSRDSFILSYASFLKTIFPEDRERFVLEQNAAMTAVHDIDSLYRIILPDGSVKWIHEIGKVIKTDSWVPAFFRGTVQDITVQKLLSASLEESNQRYSLVTKATSDAIWDWDLVKDTLYWGEGFQKIFGHHVSGIYNSLESWTDFLHPDDKAKILDGVYSVINGTEINWKDEYRYLKADGSYAYVVDRGFVIRDITGKAVRMVGAMHDITKRKTEVQRLKLLESVVVNTNDAILITEAEPLDEPGPRIVYVNEAFTKMTGYTSEEVIGKTPRILQGPQSDKKELKRLDDAMRNWQSCDITTINYKKNGEEFWLNFSVTPIADEAGWFTHWIAVERDVTQQKKAEEELKLFADELFKRNKELQQFAYVISHNLRSPVANIMGITDLLLMDKDDPDTVTHCGNSLKIAVNSLDGVIKDLSKILSATDGSASLIKEAVSFNELIESIQIDLTEAIKHSGAIIQYSGDVVVEHSNKAYLYSIFFNLISNAIKYRSAEIPHIRITAKITGVAITIEIADNGIGIDLEKHKDELFKPYKRFETKVEGKGLGLFLIKSHVEALNGMLSLESEPGIGTVFTINLPPN